MHKVTQVLDDYHAESQCRADFQDGKMIAHQLSIGLRRLVIRRVRLVHHARLPFDKAAQFMGPLRLIVLHAVRR